jgi:hypothetical protein
LKFKLLIIATSALIISFGGIAAFDNYKDIRADQEHIKHLELQREQLHNQTIELEQKSQDLEKENADTQKQLEQQKAREEQLKKEIEALKVARAERARLAAATAPRRASAAPQTSFGGNCESWIAAAGISELSSARELIRRESGCDPYVKNKSSGACGVAQELPCGKSGCSLGDGACQVKWMNSYVIGRYGSWSAAIAFHNANNWY